MVAETPEAPEALVEQAVDVAPEVTENAEVTEEAPVEEVVADAQEADEEDKG